MLEKYDGVRAFWNPQTKCFYTRTGLKKDMPQDIIDSMPNIFLDGELWYFYLSLPPLLAIHSKSPSIKGLDETTTKRQCDWSTRLILRIWIGRIFDS